MLIPFCRLELRYHEVPQHGDTISYSNFFLDLQIRRLWTFPEQYVMRCAIWYYLSNIKNVKNIHLLY